MGSRGPRPLPSALAKQRGYKPRKSRRPAGKEPMPTVGDPGMPERIAADAVARECWRTLSKKLKSMKVLTQADGINLEGLCLAYARAVQADKIVKKHGLVTKLFDGRLVPNPAVAMSRMAWGEVRKFSQEFGLTPASRTRVREETDDESSSKGKETSPDEFFFGARKAAGSRVIPFKKPD